MLRCPSVQRLQVIVVGEFGESLAPIVPDCRRIGSSIANQSQQVWSEVIASSPLKLPQEFRRPVGSVVFQAITEHCVRRLITERTHHAVSNLVKMGFDRIPIVVIENKSLSPYCWAFHCHAGATGDEENSAMRSTNVH